MGVMVCVPPGLPVTTVPMNWSVPILVALSFIILAFWYLIDEFKGPGIDWEALNLKVEAKGSGEAS
jgi:choline transport protein